MPHTDFWPFDKEKTGEHVDNGDNAKILQKQLGEVEGELCKLRLELADMRRERKDFINRKPMKVLYLDEETDVFKTEGTYPPAGQHAQFPELATLRQELIHARDVVDQESNQRDKYEAKLKELECKLNRLYTPLIVTYNREAKKYSDEEMTVLKTQVRDLREETEELKLTLVDKTEQLHDYRDKYMKAEQEVEELKHQITSMKIGNRQVSEQIKEEIQKMKMQFQDKLQELAPLPDLLKGTQIQLQEASQLQQLAEESSKHLSNEIFRLKEKLTIAVSNLNQEKADKCKCTDENKSLNAVLEDKSKEILSLSKTLEDYKYRSIRAEEKLSEYEIRYMEKTNEYAQLLKDMEELKVEKSRALGRSKERSDGMRKYMQNQISELEEQLVQSRAFGRACQKDRDEIRQRMQIQISNLQENFEIAHIRLRALQNQVTSLKNSYTVILADNVEMTELTKIGAS